MIEALDTSRRELAERADVERSLREIAARISAATDLAAVLQLGVDEAARLLHADGARIDLIEPKSGLLRWAYASGAVRPDDSIWPDDPDETLDQGVSGQAVVRGRPFWTGDYVNDTRFPHGRGADTYVTATQVRSALAAPLTGEDGPFGALTVFTSRSTAWADADAGLLEAIADQAAIMIRTTRLIEELDRSRKALRRRAEAEQALREIAARITILREPSEILGDVVEQAGRLVDADGVILDLLDPTTGNLHWALDDGLSDQFGPEERAKLWISVGVGATGVAVAEDRVIVGDDDLAGQFPPSPESTEFYERTGFRSMIVAPITGDSGPLGVLEVYSRRRAAFSSEDGGLVGALASQAAIAITNARLIDELDRSTAELARQADSERTLREIAARVSAILDPAEVLQRIVDETTRLLESDGARIDLYDPSIDALRWAYAAGDAMKVVPEWATSGGLKPGQAVAGTAFAQQRPVRTDDYLADDRFLRDDAARAFVESTGIRSVVSVPLAGDGAPLGTLSVVSRRPSAYDEADSEVLAAFATQASIAIRNARLMEELAGCGGRCGAPANGRSATSPPGSPRCAGPTSSCTAWSRRPGACSAATAPI
jgi:GAF domain-containing protein